MSETVVQTVVQERLNLTIMAGQQDSMLQTTKAWPFLPTSKSKGHQQMALFPHAVLLRSSSFDRLRQFPAYLCSASSDLRWLFSSKTGISQVIASYFRQLHALLLIISVYFAVVLLAVQVVAMLVVLASCTSVPPGFVFMIVCVCVIIGLATKAIRHEDKSIKGKVS